MEQVDIIAQKFLEPLNDATKRLLAPITFQKNDRLHVELDKEGKRFIFNFYSIFPDGTKLSPSWNTRRLMERVPEDRKSVV